jgi:hypothetical protein
VPTAKKDGHPVHDKVDAFVRKTTPTRTKYPFVALKEKKE